MAKKQSPKKRTIIERRELLAEIRKRIGKNLTDDEIIDELGLQPHILADYKRQLLDFDRAAFEHLDSVTVYSEYIQRIRRIINELDWAMKICKEKGQGQALVNAIWRKKEAYDSVIKLGQDFGFIEKRASELRVSSELSFSTMTEEEVKEEIKREVQKMNEITRNTIPMRGEVVELLDESVRNSLPSNVVVLPSKSKTKKKVKAKMKFIMRTKA